VSETSGVENTPFITDPENFPRYVAGYAGGTVRTDNATGMGSSFTWTGTLGPLKLQSTETVTEWEEGRRVGYTGAMAGVSFRSSMALEDAGKDRCLLTIHIRYEVPFRLGGPFTARLVVGPLLRRYVVVSASKLQWFAASV